MEVICSILGSATSRFPAVRYTTNKIGSKEGELLALDNFPSHFSLKSSPSKVRSLFQEISLLSRSKKPQFHGVLSGRFQDHSPKDLLELSRKLMERMGYGKQPIIYVAHKDTESNHVHIVTTRVDREKGKLVPNYFEKWNAMRILKELLGKDIQKEIHSLLSYKFQDLSELKAVFQSKGYRLVESKKNPGELHVMQHARYHKFHKDTIVFSREENLKSTNEMHSLLESNKYRYSRKVFTTLAPYRTLKRDTESIFRQGTKVLQSELQYRLSKDHNCALHLTVQKKELQTLLINHTAREVLSEKQLPVLKDYFTLTSDTISRKTVEQLKQYGVSSAEEKTMLLTALENPEVKEHMVFYNPLPKNEQVLERIRRDAWAVSRGALVSQTKIFLEKANHFQFLHERFHHLGSLEVLLSKKEYQDFKASPKARQLQAQLQQEKKETSLEQIPAPSARKDIELVKEQSTGHATETKLKRGR